MDEGVLNNSLGRHRAAEEAFRSAVGVCEQRFGVDAPKCGDVIIRLALEVSNQERYREADPLFQRGEGLVRGSKQRVDERDPPVWCVVGLGDQLSRQMGGHFRLRDASQSEGHACLNV